MNTENTFQHFQLRLQPLARPTKIAFSARFSSVCMYKTIRLRFTYSPEYILEAQNPQHIVFVAYRKLSFRTNLK